MEDDAGAPDRAHSESPAVVVWDLPVRVFHWALATAVAVSVATGLSGGLWQMQWHVISGCVILGLVIFRLIWGVIGGRHARFTDFVRGPGAVLRYARAFLAGRAAPSAGHNPMGGWSVVLILLVLAAQAGTGLFSNDDIFTEGPLFELVGKDRSDAITGDHLTIIYALYGLIVLHLAAVFWHWRRGENLVKPMVTGRKTGLDRAAGDPRPRPLAFAVAAALAGGAVYGILSLG